MNTCSSTEAEVAAADKVVGPMLWTKLFLEAQGYPMAKNVAPRRKWLKECWEKIQASQY